MTCVLAPAIRKIVSGAQTGVDRAALNVAIRWGIPCGGWCPRGRFAEDGIISRAYPLKETPNAKYEERTEWNVRDSDGTLLICHGLPIGGTAFTLGMCRKHEKPFLLLDLSSGYKLASVEEWLAVHRIETLNVAGPRESSWPGIGEETERILEAVLLG